MRRWLGFAALACVAFGARAQDLVVYDDLARNGFDGAFSFGGDIDLAHTATVFAGTTSIAYTGNAGFNAVAFARPGPPDLVATQYHTLRFFVHGGTTGGQQLRLYVQRDAETGETLVTQGELDPYIAGGAIVAGQWREVRVPLAAFGVTGGFDRIDLQTDLGDQPVLYLDEIVLIGRPALSIGTVTVPQGAASVRVPVTFLAGSAVETGGFDVSFGFVRGGAVAAAGPVTVEPGSLPAASFLCGGTATTQAAGNGLACIANANSSFVPIGSGTVATFTLPLNPVAPLGTYPFGASSGGAASANFFNQQASAISGDFVLGAIVVASGTAPTLSYTPSPPTQIDLPGGALGASVQTSVSVQTIGGSGVGAVQLACAVGQPFVLFDQDEFTLTAGGDPVSIDIACDLAGTEEIGTLSCNETDLPGGSTRLREWPLRCPAGSAASIAVGNVVGNRAGPVAVPVTLIGDGNVFGALGDVEFDPAILTPTQIAAANTASCFRLDNDTIRFIVPSGPTALAQQETTYCNLVFVLADLAPIASTPLTLAATNCLDGANQTTTCLTSDGSVTTSGFVSSPRPGSALTLTALPGQSSATSRIVAINFGATGIPVASCTPDPAAGFTIDPNGAFTLGPTDNRDLNLACTPPAAGLPPRVSDLACLLQDTTPARVVRYRLVCSPASTVGPIAGSSLLGPGAGAGDEVGSALASTLTANGEEITVIGAPFGGTDDGGRAFVVVRAAGAGTFDSGAKRAGGGLAHDALDIGTAHALSATTAVGDKFGGAVAINAAGDRIAVGAPGANFAGRVYVFVRPAGGWTTLDIPTATLEAPTGPAAQDVTPDDFGAQVAYTQGDMLVVGAPLSDLGAGATVDAGAAFVYPAGAVAPTAIMRSPAIETGAQFGSAIAANGGSLAVGAPLENAASNADRGAVYVMSAPGAPVEPTQRVVAAGGGIGDKFGRSVAYVGRTLVVGAPEDDTATGTDAGSATVFNGDTSTGFIERVTFTPPGGALQQAGAAVATNGDIVLLGAPLANVDGRAAQGRVFAFDLPEGAIVASPVATAIDGAAGQSGDRFGAFLANSPRRLIVGVPKDDNELGIGGTSVQVDEGRADPFLFDRILRVGFE